MGERASLGARSGRVDSQAEGSRRCGQPDVECRERGRAPGRGKRQMESVGSAQRSRLQREQELFRLAVDVTRQLDAAVDALIEAREDRVLQPSRGLARERLLVKSPRGRGNDFGYGQVGYENIMSSRYRVVELVASRFR